MSKKKPAIQSTPRFADTTPGEDTIYIHRFTEQGIDELVDYYNQKYPDRGSIYRASAWAAFLNGTEETKEEKEERIVMQRAESATHSIEAIRKAHTPPIKIMLTIFYPDKEEGDHSEEIGTHTIPVLLTEDKLIILRDDNVPYYNFLDVVAKNLGVKFVRQTLKHEDSSLKKTSIQADMENCHGIAAAILKDLTIEDIKEVAKFETDDYRPLAKMLKYSQSKTHITENFPNLADAVVKIDGTTLMEYISRGKKGGCENRIDSKMDRIKETMRSIDVKEIDEQDQRSWGQRILDSVKQRKQKSDSRHC